MTSKERIDMVLSGGIPDRVPFHDSYWQTTIQRWHKEGLPRNISPDDYFGTEIVRIGGDYSLQFPVEIIEETEEYRIYIDSNGAKRKDFKTTGDGWTPHWLEFTIKTPSDWVKHQHLAKFNSSRIPKSVLQVYQRARERRKFIIYSGHACFHPTWHKIGLENQLALMLDNPPFIIDLFEAHTNLMIDIYKGMKQLGLDFDAAWFNDDLGYRNGPLISPEMYKELVFPFHKRLCDYFASEGLKTMLHSDGNVAPLIPHFIEAGFVALHPLEAKVGLDVRDLKPIYQDRLVLFGNIDVRALASDLETIEEEIKSKLNIAKEGGGYIYHSDHSVPDNVSFGNYKFAVELVRLYGKY
jgi:uroporphyrinogen decarboxylase